MYKIFVDGQEGTTGLQINERLSKYSGIEILKIDSEKKKDIELRRKFLNEADIVFLCLPDDAARESVALVSNEKTCIIDASTAHRTNPDWTYGFPELKGQREKIKRSKRIAVPGCYATGFIALMYPLVKEGLVQPDYPVTLHAISGYSGGGKKLISQYQSDTIPDALCAPRPYSARLNHKHLPEMQNIVGLDFRHFLLLWFVTITKVWRSWCRYCGDCCQRKALPRRSINFFPIIISLSNLYVFCLLIL